MLAWIKNLFERPVGPLDNVTPRMQRLLVLARRQADRLHHSYVGTEHLLLGLLELKEGVAYGAMRQMQVDLPGLQQRLDTTVQVGKMKKVLPSIPYTPVVKKVLKLGSEEAIALGHNYLGTEHLLLGMLRPGRTGIGGQVLKQQGLRLEIARIAVVKVLTPPAPEAPKPT